MLRSECTISRTICREVRSCRQTLRWRNRARKTTSKNSQTTEAISAYQKRSPNAEPTSACSECVSLSRTVMQSPSCERDFASQRTSKHQITNSKSPGNPKAEMIKRPQSCALSVFLDLEL